MPTTEQHLEPPSTALVSIIVEAPIDEVWAIVSDPRRYGELSPEAQGAELSSPLSLGTSFEGRNRRGGNEWTTPCTVTAFDPPHVFAFEAGEGDTASTWMFTLREVGDGQVEVVQSFDSKRLRHADWLDRVVGRHGQLVEDMQSTLAELKATVEGELEPR